MAQFDTSYIRVRIRLPLYGHIFYCFRDIARCWSKIPIFFIPLQPIPGENGCEYVPAVPYPWPIKWLNRFCTKFLRLHTAQTHYRHTDGQTDRRKSDLNRGSVYYATLADKQAMQCVTLLPIALQKNNRCRCNSTLI